MEERHEIIEFPENSPVRIFLHRLGNVNRHWHSSLEILFILSGTLSAVVDNQSYELREEDIILINSNAIHSLYSDGCELAAYQINYQTFRTLPIQPGISFHCISCEAAPGDRIRFDRLKYLLARLLKINEERANPLLTLSVLTELLYELETHFRSEEPSRSEDNKNLQRLASITDYIRQHYREALTLTQLAAHEHFSVSYLSRFFKENMGMNFSDYYNAIRLEHAVSDLTAGTASIATVAADNGFPDVRTFVSLFKKQYHMLPSDYRKSHPAPFAQSGSLPEINYLAITNSDSLQKLAKYLKPERDSAQKETDTAVVPCRSLGNIATNHTVRKLRHTFRKLCCVGSTRDLFSAEVQRELTRIQQETPYSYIRFHGLLSNDTMVYDETAAGKPVFSFARIDQLMDFLLSINLKPVLQLSFTPDALASQPDKTSFYIRYNTSAPRDYDRWAMLIERLLTHLTERYSAAEVNSWPVILWNEPDTPPVMFGFKNNQQFFRLYQRTWEAVRSVSKAIPIGTPPLMLFHEDFFGFSGAFFDFCRENSCMPDFINVNCYSDVLDFKQLCEDYSAGISQSKLPASPDTLAAFLDQLPGQAASYRVEALPIAISEWNVTVNHRNLINDTCYKACYLAKNILENYDRAEAFGYWSLTDYISELQPSEDLFHGGLGLLTANGIPKPPCHVARFLFSLGDDMLGRGDGWFATKDSRTGQIQVIFYNYCHYSQLFASGENFDMTLTNRYTIFPDQKCLRFSLTLTGLDAGFCRIEEQFVNREHGSAYDNWVAMGASRELSRENIEYLRQISRPGCVIRREQISNHTLELDVTLQPFEVRMVTVTL